MSLREKINSSPKAMVGAVGGVIFLLAALTYFQFSSSSMGGKVIGAQAYFTSETTSSDAAIKAMVTDSSLQPIPIMKNGKPAFRARVWSSDGGATRYVSHFERYDLEAGKRVKDLIDNARKRKLDDATIVSSITEDLVLNGGLEVLFPGEDAWHPYMKVRDQIEKHTRPAPSKVPIEVQPD